MHNYSHVGLFERPCLSPLRPKVNSLLHLFGQWLFEASFIGTEFALASTSTSTNIQNPDPKAKRPSTLGIQIFYSVLNAYFFSYHILDSLAYFRVLIHLLITQKNKSIVISKIIT